MSHINHTAAALNIERVRTALRDLEIQIQSPII